jgi:dihydroxyacetone kinase-like predicted kinase
MKMNKKEFNKLVKEAREEFNEERKERIKAFIKERLQEYEMAKATVKKIEKQFAKLQKEGLADDVMLLEYDDR